MSRLVPPVRDMQFVLHEVLECSGALTGHPAGELAVPDLVDPILEQGARFCAEVLHPLNRVGDEEGCTRMPNAEVRTPTGFRDAWQQFCAAGWPALTARPDYGGQGLPHVVGTAFQEMLNSANQAWAMYPGLTHGAYDCLLAHGTSGQKSLYLPRLVSGEWTGTMCLTEPQCGTDLGLIRTRAEPQADGSYRLTGHKIFISSGEHDLSANIVHLVLARLPDAPAGTRGLSLFVVPKFLPDDQGEPGVRNTITCARLEAKMGIHGNATCAMDLDGATGWLVGEAHRGLAAMFVMMNVARIGVGVQSLGLMQAAYQQSVDYARQREQSRSLTGAKSPDAAADPIIVHADVRRMLLTQKAWVEGGRCFAYWLALQADRAEGHPDAEVRARAADHLALLTPVVKALLTDSGFACTNLALQVFGGHGYIREWGIEQYVRDARINMIYEGTNGIQALDLLGRKVLGDQGARLRAFGEVIRGFVDEKGTREAAAEFIDPLADLAGRLEKFTFEIGMKALANPDEVGAAAADYLRVIGHLVMSYLWARMACVALDRIDEQTRAGVPVDPFYETKLATARFYFARLQPETAMLMRSARSGAAVLMSLDADRF